MQTNRTTVRLNGAFIADLTPTNKRQTYRDTECKGLVLRVYPGGDLAWYFDYRLDGRRWSYRIGRATAKSRPGCMTVGDARRHVRTLGAHPAGERRHERASAKAAAGRTLRALLEREKAPTGRYWTDYLAYRKSGAATHQRILGAWAPFLDTDMAALDPAAVARHRAQRQAKGVKPQTLNRDRTALLAMINKAVEWRVIDHNPLDDPAFRPLQMADHKRVRWLGQRDELETHSLGERERFLRALRDEATPPYLRQMVRLAMNTGLRRGEIFGLRWENVSTKRRELTVHADTAKTNKTRHVPLNDEALVALEQVGNIRHISGYVFVNPETEKPFDDVKRSWGSLTRRAKLEDFTFHDLRHDYASRLVQAGVDLYVVRDLLGHSSIQLTERYAHLRPAAKHAAVALLNAQL